MSRKLKGIILSVEDVLINSGQLEAETFKEVKKLFAFFKTRKIQPVLLYNREWKITQNGKVISGKDWFTATFPGVAIFSRSIDPAVPAKPQASSTAFVLKKMGWAANETVLIGSSLDDMRTAVNGGLLFLRATWYANKTDYGFEFNTPKEIARFIDIFCLREHFWSHEIQDDDFEFYALAPFSTYKPEYAKYSEDARNAAKHNTGHPEFWLSALVTSLYFTGVHEDVDFIAAYPPHKSGVLTKLMDEDLSIFGKCFRKAYLHDLIVRHTHATKSATARAMGQGVDHLNQLNTIHLTDRPCRYLGEAYKNPPLYAGRKVLLLDDICTNGYSFEAARQYLQQLGVKTVMVAWLKTINTNIELLEPLEKFNPYIPNKFVHAKISKVYVYNSFLVDKNASTELSAQLAAFMSWNWP